MKKAWNVIKNILVIAVVIIAVVMVIFTFFSVTMVDKNNRKLFGYRLYIVGSDSMKMTDFAAGDMIIVKDVDPSTLKAGDIISFQSTNVESFGETITHKIREVSKDSSGNPAFKTYGTTTNADDEKLVTYNFVYGKYVGKIPKIGYVFQYVKTAPGYIICILIPFLLLIAIQGVRCVKIFNRYKQEQYEALEEEQKKIDEQRAEQERILKEINELKEMLAKKNGNKN